MEKIDLKFDKLSDLLKEIDAWIEQLQEKRKEVLSKIDLEVVKQAFPGDRGKYTTSHDGYIYKMIKVGKDDRREVKIYTTNIDSSNYDLLKQEADKVNESVSSFLKNNYFMNLIYDKNLNAKYIKEYSEIANNIKDKIEVKDKKSVGVVLNKNEDENLKNAIKKLEISERDFIRFLVYEFMYDKLVNKQIRPAYIEEDNKIEYIKCKSSNVQAFGYDSANKKLYVTFVGGAKYKYENIPHKMFDDFCLAESKGRYVNEILKVNYKGIKIN